MNAPLQSGRDEAIADNEPLQRAIISKSQFSGTRGRVKPALLSPNPHVELSVSRIGGLGERKIRLLADDVAKKRGKPASLGYGKLRVRAPRCLGLDVVADEPPCHHANIVGWPSDTDPDDQRRRQLQLAKALVEEVELVQWKPPVRL